MEIDGAYPIMAGRLAGTTRAYRSHSEAERKRRQRINSHLATLRTIIPAATRMDKATLLREVVRHVRELQVFVDDVAVVVPTEGDEARVEKEGSRVRAWVSCSDRPGLMSELNRAVRSVRARPIRAEISTVGGRTRSALELEFGNEMRADEGRSALFAVLRSVFVSNGPGSVDFMGDNYKRQRLSSRLGSNSVLFCLASPFLLVIEE